LYRKNKPKISKKLDKLKNILRSYPGVVVAFSGGVDSSLLLKIAKEVLKDYVIAITAASPIHPKDEIDTARTIAQKLKCKHIIFQSKELENPKFVKNLKTRCYYCKIDLFKNFKRIAAKYGYDVIEGSNTSDLSDYRPGFKALNKLGIKSPFIESNINKKEIRRLAKKFRLPNWNKPSMACLASRIPYEKIINKKILKRIEAAEAYLKKRRLTQVRVRDHYPIARIEVLNNEFKIVLKHRKKITTYLQNLGYKYITIDLQGYQTGSLNR
jgi:uncharacterized protein